MKAFKVMTQKDRAFGGKFNPEKVENYYKNPLIENCKKLI